MVTRWHVLKPNKRLEAPSHIVVYDTETVRIEEAGGKEAQHCLRLGVARYFRLEKGRVSRLSEMVFKTPEEFWSFIDSHAYPGCRLYVFSHNQHFDFNVCQGFRFLKELGFTLRHIVLDSDTFIIVAKNGKRSIMLTDTANYFKTPLHLLGKLVGLEKLSVDFDNCSLKELEEYCRRDVEILSRLIVLLLNLVKDNNLGGFAPTAAGLAFKSFRHRFMFSKIFIHRHPKAVKLEEESYRGGRNECFRIGKVEGVKLYELDINSMYPSVMLDNRFPTKLVKYVEPATLSGLLDALTRFLVIADVDVTLEEPVIGVKEGKLVFPIGSFRVVLTTPELLDVMRYGQINKVHRYAIYEHSRIFQDYVKFFYTLKLEAEKDGNTAMREFAKLMLNSLYGKFGQRVKRWVKEGDVPMVENGVEMVISAVTGERYMRVVLNGVAYRVQHAELSENSFPAIASFVTAYARQKLTKLIIRAGWFNVFYCDTDSLIVNEEGFNNLKSFCKEQELGFLKLKAVHSDAVFVACKHYQLGKQEAKLKGIRKDAEQLSVNEYRQVQFLKTKSLLRRSVAEGVIEKQVIKRLALKYDKANVSENGLVSPFQFPLSASS